MDSHEAIVVTLVEFSTVEEIKADWKAVGESLSSRARDTITVNQKTIEGRTTAGIELSTPQEKTAYISACRDAIADLEGNPRPSSGRTVTDHSGGPLLV